MLADDEADTDYRYRYVTAGRGKAVCEAMQAGEPGAEARFCEFCSQLFWGVLDAQSSDCGAAAAATLTSAAAAWRDAGGEALLGQAEAHAPGTVRTTVTALCRLGLARRALFELWPVRAVLATHASKAFQESIRCKELVVAETQHALLWLHCMAAHGACRAEVEAQLPLASAAMAVHACSRAGRWHFSFFKPFETFAAACGAALCSWPDSVPVTSAAFNFVAFHLENVVREFGAHGNDALRAMCASLARIVSEADLNTTLRVLLLFGAKGRQDAFTVLRSEFDGAASSEPGLGHRNRRRNSEE